jgi:hypothetical protein
VSNNKGLSPLNLKKTTKLVCVKEQQGINSTASEVSFFPKVRVVHFSGTSDILKNSVNVSISAAENA